MIKRFLGWEKCEFSDYELCCNTFGFNAESSPKYIKYALDKGVSLDFFTFSREGKVKGAVCVDNGWLANDHKNPKNSLGWMSIPAYSIAPPFNKEVKCILPFKSKSLNIEMCNFLNSSFSAFSKRHVAIAKDLTEFSTKAISSRRRDIRKFISDGGSFVDVNSVDPDFLFDSYSDLFSDRRNLDKDSLSSHRDFFRYAHGDFFGEMAFLDNRPVGIQLILSTASKYGRFINFLNIGYAMDLRKYSIGNMLMWRNLHLVSELDEPVCYSYGMMSGEYKNKWCNPVKTGRVLTV